MKKTTYTIIIALLWVCIRFVISFKVGLSDLSSITRLLIMFGPIAPLLLAVYFHIKEKGNAFTFGSIFKTGAKAGFIFSLVYLIGLLVLFNFVNPVDFTGRKALIIAQQIEANEIQGISSPEETREKINEIFTAFNYASVSFMALVALSVFYSLLMAFLAQFFSKRAGII